MKQVIACIDGSPVSEGVCDYAIWATQRLDTDLEFLHVVTKHTEDVPIADLSGSIWLGAQEALLKELAELDEKRNTLAQEQGRKLLDVALQRARAQGVTRSDARQRHGDLVQTLTELEPDTRLFVLGQHERPRHPSRLMPDLCLEAAVRALHRPILVASASFREPRSFMLAYDGSPTSRKTVEVVSRSPLLAGMPAHIVMAAPDATAAEAALDVAKHMMEEAGFETRAAHVHGEPAEALAGYAQTHGIDLLAMGAYGHSRIRHLVLGSTTTAILGRVRIPVAVLR